MNTNILLKCLKELQEPEPKLDYLRGMIETLIEMSHPTIEQAAKVAGIITPMTGLKGGMQSFVDARNDGDAASILDARARDAIATARELEKNGTIATEQP